MNESKELKVISLKKDVILVKEPNSSHEVISTEDEEVIVASFLCEEDTIEDISELVGVVYDKFSEACNKLNLKWEAEIEMGLQFGVKFSAKLKISPKDIKNLKV